MFLVLGNRASCLLDNKELVESLGKVKKILFEDFTNRMLREYDSCSKNFSEEYTLALHGKLWDVYTEISELFVLLDNCQS